MSPFALDRPIRAVSCSGSSGQTPEVPIRGILVLSGLAEAFQPPPGVPCLALHGTADERLPIALAGEVASGLRRSLGSAFEFEELQDVGHAIPDEALERIAAFCRLAAPAGGADGGAEQATAVKLARYLKRMSEGVSMYDKEWCAWGAPVGSATERPQRLVPPLPHVSVGQYRTLPDSAAASRLLPPPARTPDSTGIAARPSDLEERQTIRPLAEVPQKPL